MSRHGSRKGRPYVPLSGSPLRQAADLQRGEIDANVAMLGIPNRNAVSPGRAIRPRGNPEGRRCSRRPQRGLIRDESPMCRLRHAWSRSETPISLTRHLLRAMPMPSWRAQDFWSPGHALSPKVVGAMPGTARIPRVQRARRVQRISTSWTPRHAARGHGNPMRRAAKQMSPA